MKKFLHLFIILALALSVASCERKDDIDEIFVGKTWYMMSGTYNAQALDTKGFFTYATEGFQLNFQASNFSGVLSPGVSFSGTWSADGKNRNLSLRISQGASAGSTFDHNVYAVLKDINYYEGDSNYLILYKDKVNFIRFSTNRSPIAQ